MTMQAEIETDHNVLRLFFSLKIEKCFGFFFQSGLKWFVFLYSGIKPRFSILYSICMHSVSLTKKNMQYYFGCFLFINNNLQQKDMLVYIIYNDSNKKKGRTNGICMKFWKKKIKFI